MTATCDLLLRRVALLSDADLYDPDGMSAVVGLLVGPLISGIMSTMRNTPWSSSGSPELLRQQAAGITFHPL